MSTPSRTDPAAASGAVTGAGAGPEAPTAPAYVYRARVERPQDIYDGDTITVIIDLGFHIEFGELTLRLYGINAPELRGAEKEAGRHARDWLRERLKDREFIVQTIRDRKGKYGRYLAIIWVDGVNVNEEMVALGLAERRDYDRRRRRS
jgi:micrococcal nuclease